MVLQLFIFYRQVVGCVTCTLNEILAALLICESRFWTCLPFAAASSKLLVCFGFFKTMLRYIIVFEVVCLFVLLIFCVIKL